MLKLTLQDRGTDSPRSAAQSTLALLVIASLATPNVALMFSRDSDLAPELGVGAGTELAGYVLRTSRVPQVVVPLTPSVAGTISAVTKVDTHLGPTITVAGASWDSLRYRLEVVDGGALGVATFRLALDGATLGPTIDVPAQPHAGLQGTGDLSAIDTTTLNTKTFIIDSDVGAPETVTFVSPATPQAVVDQLNSGTAAKTFRLVSGRYVGVVSDTAGAAGTLSVGAGTANADLGFTNLQAATGAAATYEIPGTEIVVTFPVGTYLAGTAYTWTTTEPRCTTTDVAAALAALRTSGLDFEEVVLGVQPIDADEALVFAAGLDSGVTAWQGAAPRKFHPWMMGTPLSATPGSRTSDQTNDNATKTALASFSSQIGGMAHGDVYLPGTELPGLFRRPAVWALAGRAAAYRLSSDPGNGEQPTLESASMVGPDGALARDEDNALVPMKPQRFTVLHANRGGADFVRGVTRATPGSKFRHLGVQRMALLAARTAYVAMKPYDNADRDATPEGKLVPSEADAIEQAITSALESALVDSPIPGQGHASAAIAAVDREEKVTETDNLTVTFTVQHKAQFETVTGIVGIVSTFSLA